jgi:hypothetical protein
LAHAWDLAEQKAIGQDWDELAVWVIYKLLHKRAALDYRTKSFRMYPSQLNKEEFKVVLFEELQQEGYEQMLKELNADTVR